MMKKSLRKIQSLILFTTALTSATIASKTARLTIKYAGKAEVFECQDTDTLAQACEKYKQKKA